MLILAMTCGIPVLSISWRWVLLFPASLAIALTFSRAAWLVLGITVLWFMWQGYFGGRASRFILALTAIFTVGFLGSAMFTGSLADLVLASPIGPYLDSNTLARLGGSEFATDYSANQRAEVAELAISSFLSSDYPLVGYGIGYTHEWSMPVSTHNMYLMHLVEGGIIGFSFFVSLIVLLWRNASGISRLVVLQIATDSLFDHNVLDSPGRVLFIAIAASGALNYRSVRDRPNEKAP
jgi:O-antigen ligase